MDLETTALPTGDTAAAGEQAQTTQAASATDQQGEQHQAQGQEQDKPEGEGDKPESGKKEKTPEQREIERLRRRVDAKTRREYELRAELEQARGRAPSRPQQDQQPGADDEPVTLSRAELDRMIAERASKLAPAVKEQQAEIERRNGVVQTLAKAWGQEKFDAIASDLDDVMGGLADAGGRPKPATEAIFEADDPKGVIEYLTDPDNAADAERIASLSAVRAGREIARIELKLKEEKAKAKAKPSNAARPIEAVKGGGVPSGMPDPSNTKAYIAWANAQERATR